MIMENNITVMEEQSSVETPVVESPISEPVEDKKHDDAVKFGLHSVIEIALYIAGIIFLIFCFMKLGQDLDTISGEFHFFEETYVGGDAYNYIISAARSSAVMVKSLIFGVLGSSSIISGLLLRIASKK